MKKISKPTSKLIFSFLTLILSCAVFYFILRGISANNEEASSAHSRYLEKVALQEKISSLKDQVNDTQDERVAIEELFLDSADTVGFLTYLEGLFALSGTTGEISSVSKDDTLGEGGRPLLYISLEAEGDFNSIYSYINFVENIPYEYKIENSSLTLKKSTDPLIADTWLLSTSMVIESINI